ncbi:DNA polymerase alpha catalytic subunit-like isoform X1 [Periplaneta americana]|uniref:DNA polymerase alpha catalytic subunit-like isoform X1 n=1 Tax=Periplaneta americana TaxID=6978 RepID=UPI0037E77FB6
MHMRRALSSLALCLFGKVWIESAKAHVSCCVAVKNIQRRIYLLPREKHYDMKTKTDKEEEVTMMDVYKEFNEKIPESHKILQFKSRKVDATTHLIFQSTWRLYTLLMVPSDLQVEVFSHVFGTNTSALEHLLRGLAGWLDLSAAFTRPSHMAWPVDFNAASSHYLSTKLEKMDTERALPGQADPDLIVGHDLHGYGLAPHEC